MTQAYTIPRNDFEAIEKFDSYKDDGLVIKMVEFYQEQRNRNVPLENTYLKTLEIYNTLQKTFKATNSNLGSQTILQCLF